MSFITTTDGGKDNRQMCMFNRAPCKVTVMVMRLCTFDRAPCKVIVMVRESACLTEPHARLSLVMRMRTFDRAPCKVIDISMHVWPSPMQGYRNSGENVHVWPSPMQGYRNGNQIVHVWSSPLQGYVLSRSNTREGKRSHLRLRGQANPQTGNRGSAWKASAPPNNTGQIRMTRVGKATAEIRKTNY